MIVYHLFGGDTLPGFTTENSITNTHCKWSSKNIENSMPLTQPTDNSYVVYDKHHTIFSNNYLLITYFGQA